MRYLRPLRMIAAALFLLGLALSILAIRATDEKRSFVLNASNGLMYYALAQRTLQLDLLDARASLLRNYDPVNLDIASARRSLAKLEQLELGPEARKHLALHINQLQRQSVIVEQFKSRNALLQNSVTRLTDYGPPDTGVLLAGILKLSLDTTPQARHVHGVLQRLSTNPSVTATRELRPHVKLLATVLPQLDALLHAVRGMRMEARIEELQTAIQAETRKRAAVALRFQLALTVTLILLVATVLAIFVLQRLRSHELRVQAANARLSAAIATPLIDAANVTFSSRVEDAVHLLSRHICLRRVELIIPELPGFRPISWPGPSNRTVVHALSEAADREHLWRNDCVVASRSSYTSASSMARLMDVAGIEHLVLLRVTTPFRVVLALDPESATIVNRRDHMAGIFSAITAIAHGARREMMHLEQERLGQKLARARRMETIGVMASGVSHNFNNILGAISGFSEIGQENPGNAALSRNCFGEIQGAVKRARELVDNILDFAKRRHEKKKPINLVTILDQTERLIHASLRHGAILELQSPRGSLPVLGSAADLQQVFFNICNNAVHMSGEAPIIVECSLISNDEEQTMSHGSIDPGTYVVVSVSDSGPGIPAAAMRRLFEPFFTTKEAGTGLGLSTAWEIVQDHGGTIDVTNLPGRGARFTVWLPCAQVLPSSRIPAAGAPILLIADMDLLPETEELLAELGYEPVSFRPDAEARKLREALIVCDAALIVTSDITAMNALIEEISPALDDQRLLASTPVGSGPPCDGRCVVLSYPIRLEELASKLLGDGWAHETDGSRLDLTAPE